MKNLIALILVLTGWTASAQVVEWKVLVEGVQIRWDLPNDAHNGTMNKISATIFFDAENPDSCRFEVTIDPASIDTKNEKRDAHLKSADYFDVKKYPSILFRSNTVTKTDNGYNVNGKLEVKGKTTEINIAFTFALTQIGGVFNGRLEVNTTEIGITGVKSADAGVPNCNVSIAVPVTL